MAFTAKSPPAQFFFHIQWYVVGMLSDTESTGGEIKNRDDHYTVGRHNIVVPDFLY